MHNLLLEMEDFVPGPSKNTDRIECLVAAILHDAEQSEIQHLTRTLRIFTETLRNDCAVSPRFVQVLDDRQISTNLQFQAMLLDIALTHMKSGRIEEFLRLSMEYPTIFRIREAILGNDSIQALIRERLGFMEENGQCSIATMLRSHLRE